MTAPQGTSSSLITDEVRAALAIGQECGVFEYRVTANDVERYVFATSDRGAAWRPPARYVSGKLPPGTPAPPAFYIALDPVERGDLQVEQFLADVPYLPTGGGNAFNEVRYHRPIRVGDRITVRTTYSDVYEKDGRVGRLLFRVRENAYRDPDEAPIAESRCGHVRAYDLTRWKDGSRVR